MPIRTLRRGSAVLGAATPTAVPVYVDSNTNILKVIPAGSGTTEVQVVDASSVQTLTNKTLTAPTLTAVTITGTSTIGNGMTLTTPVLGAATATSINKVTITAPATAATLTIADGSSLITAGAYAITLTATGTTGVTLPTTGTLATLAGTETLSGKTLTTPVLGVATATSINKVAFTAPATAATLTLIDGTTITGPPATGTLATLAGTETLSGKTLTAPVINVPNGATSTGVMITKRVLFTENATNTVHTGTIAIPAGAWVHSIEVTNQALWGAASAALDVGDTADPNGYFAAVDCKATDLVVGEILSTTDDGCWGGKNGTYLTATGVRGAVADNFGKYYAAGSNILGVMTVGTPAATTGRTILSVTYSVGEAIAAVATGP